MLTKEELLFRKTGIGGSDAAAVVSLSEWSSPVDVYFSKVRDNEDRPTEAMKRGNILEPFVKRLCEYKLGCSFDKKSMIRSNDKPFMIANLDGWIDQEKAVVELKTADYSQKSKWGEEGTDEIPREYLIQSAHYSSVLGAKKSYIGVLFGTKSTFKAYELIQEQINKGQNIDLMELGCDFKLYEYISNQNLENKLSKKEESFWFDYVEKKVIPPINISDAEEILRAFPVAEDKSIRIGPEEIAQVIKLKGIKESIKELEKEEKLIKPQVLMMFGEASSIIDESGETLATWKNQKQSNLDIESLKEMHPEIYTKFLKSGLTRRLSVK